MSSGYVFETLAYKYDTYMVLQTNDPEHAIAPCPAWQVRAMISFMTDWCVVVLLPLMLYGWIIEDW